MPLIAYACECGYSEKKFIRRAKDAPVSLECPVCGNLFKKMLSSPSSSSKITVDNGFMAKAVEVSPDIVEINQERADQDYHNED